MLLRRWRSLRCWHEACTVAAASGRPFRRHGGSPRWWLIVGARLDGVRDTNPKAVANRPDDHDRHARPAGAAPRRHPGWVRRLWSGECERVCRAGRRAALRTGRGSGQPRSGRVLASPCREWRPDRAGSLGAARSCAPDIRGTPCCGGSGMSGRHLDGLLTRPPPAERTDRGRPAPAVVNDQTTEQVVSLLADRPHPTLPYPVRNHELQVPTPARPRHPGRLPRPVRPAVVRSRHRLRRRS